MSQSQTPLRVVIDARLVSGTTGGTEQTIIGLAHGLAQLEDGDEEYLFLTHADSEDWIRPYVGGPCRIFTGPPVPREPKWKHMLKSAPLLRAAWHTLSARLGRSTFRVPISDGTIERAAVDLMHFTMQTGFLTRVPTIYSPLDLQHLHLPQFFTPRVRMAREMTYRTLCEQASMVVALSSWVKRDLIDHYHLPEVKVHVIPCAPVLDAYPAATNADLEATRRKFSLPAQFVFYPAHTWPHKNHIALLEALAMLRDRHQIKAPLVCSGRITEDHFHRIEARTREMGLSSQVQFLGYVSTQELQVLYRLCRCLVFPSKFEGFGMPVLEAFRAGVPVACSDVTCLPSLAGNAALVFDPDNPDQITEALLRLWTDEALCQTLIERGHARASAFSWQRTARTFRAHYRRLTGRNLTDEDRSLLGAPSLV